MEEKKRGLPLTEVVAIVLIVGLLAAIIIPTRSRVNESAKRASCKGRLRHIGIAMHLYADDYGKAFPSMDPVPPAMDADPAHTVQAFAMLYPKYTENCRLFSCPSNPAHNNGADYAAGGTLTVKSTGYAYDCRHSSSHAGPVVIAGDAKGEGPITDNHGGAGGNYLFIDSSVMWVRAVPGQTTLVVDPTVDPNGIWDRTNGYAHDSCLRRTDK